MKKNLLIITSMTLLLFLLNAAALVGQEPPGEDQDFSGERDTLVQELSSGNPGLPPAYLAPFETVPRHRFIPEHYLPLAYDDIDLPVGRTGIAPSPSLLLAAAASLQPAGGENLLIIGSGTAYTAAIFSRLYEEVDVIEFPQQGIVPSRNLVRELGYTNIAFYSSLSQVQALGKKYRAVFIHTAVSKVPPEVISLLQEPGSLVVPLSGSSGLQNLVLFNNGPMPVIETVYESFFPVSSDDIP